MTRYTVIFGKGGEDHYSDQIHGHFWEGWGRTIIVTRYTVIFGKGGEDHYSDQIHGHFREGCGGPL